MKQSILSSPGQHRFHFIHMKRILLSLTLVGIVACSLAGFAQTTSPAGDATAASATDQGCGPAGAAPDKPPRPKLRRQPPPQRRRQRRRPAARRPSEPTPPATAPTRPNQQHRPTGRRDSAHRHGRRAADGRHPEPRAPGRNQLHARSQDRLRPGRPGRQTHGPTLCVHSLGEHHRRAGAQCPAQ